MIYNIRLPICLQSRQSTNWHPSICIKCLYQSTFMFDIRVYINIALFVCLDTRLADVPERKYANICSISVPGMRLYPRGHLAKNISFFVISVMTVILILTFWNWNCPSSRVFCYLDPFYPIITEIQQQFSIF